jgi:hypothetical protein
MINSDGIILEFIKNNGISCTVFFLFLKNWAVAHSKVENNSAFTLIAVTLSEAWGTVQGMFRGRTVSQCIGNQDGGGK